MEKSACIGAMANRIATERRCVVGSILSHFLPVVYWLGVYNHSLYSLIALSPACFVHIFGVERWV